MIKKNVSVFMEKRGITDADLDRMAAPYESGSFELEPEGKVFCGSHLTEKSRHRTVQGFGCCATT